MYLRTYGGVWNRRIYDLAGSQGWTLLETAQHLGFRQLLPLNRILRGGRPKVQVLLTLQKLEQAYEREIKEFIHQQRPFKKYQRKRRAKLRYAALYSTSAGPTSRPSDIAEMGVVEAVGQAGRDGSGEGQKRAPRVVYWSDPRRYKRKTDREVKSG